MVYSFNTWVTWETACSSDGTGGQIEKRPEGRAQDGAVIPLPTGGTGDNVFVFGGGSGGQLHGSQPLLGYVHKTILLLLPLPQNGLLLLLHGSQQMGMGRI